MGFTDAVNQFVTANSTNSEVHISGPISTPPIPECWCSVAQFHFDTPVGDTYRVSSNSPKVSINCYVGPSGDQRLGSLSGNFPHVETFLQILMKYRYNIK